MKLSKNIARILAVLLMIAMLAGYAPAGADKAASDPDSGAVVLADDEGGAVPADNPTDGEPAQEGEGNTTNPTENTPPSGEGGETPDPSGEGGDEPDPSGEGGEPQVVTFKVTFDEKLFTVKNGEEAVASGDEVENGTVLSIVAKENKGIKVFAVTDARTELTAADGAYSCTVDADVAIEGYGIESVAVSGGNDWTKSKTITVKTFGDVKSVALLDGEDTVEVKDVSNGEVQFAITVEQNEDGTTYQLQPSTLTKAELDEGTAAAFDLDKVDVKVAKIDRTKPTASLQSREEVTHSSKYYEKYKIYDYTIYTISVNNVDGTVSGAKSNIVSVVAVGYERGWLGGASEVDTFTAEKKGGNWVFNANQKDIDFFVVTVTDEAGNAFTFQFNSKENPQYYDAPTVETAETSYKGPDDQYVSHPVEDNQFYYGPKTLFVITPKSNIDGSYVAEVTVNDKGPVTSNEAEWSFDAAALSDKEVNASVHLQDRYPAFADVTYNTTRDDAAPEIGSLTYEVEDQTAFETIVHAITGGLLYHQKVAINCDVSDEGSGVDRVYYKVTGDEGWTCAGTKSTFAVDLSKLSGDVEIQVCVTDKAGNVSDEKTVSFKVKGDDGEDVEKTNLTQDATTREEGAAIADANLVVFTTTKTEEGYDPYNCDQNGWVKSVRFTVKYDFTEYAKLNTKAIEPSADTVGQVYYSVDAPAIHSVVANYYSGPEMSESGIYTWTFELGEEENVQYKGDVDFSVAEMTVLKHTIIQTAEAKYDTDNNLISEAKYDVETSEIPVPAAALSVPVKVQNYLKAAEVTDIGTPTDNGWLNGLKNQIGAVTVTAPDSAAPAWTDYKLEYQPVVEDQENAAWETVVETKGFDPEAEDASQLPSLDAKQSVDLNTYFVEGNDGLYRLTVKSHDVLNNVPDSEPIVIEIKFDQTPADINVAFEENSHDKANGEYYDVQRTATIKIFDATFTQADGASKLKELVEKKLGADAETLQDWTFTPEKSGGGTWTKILTYGVKSGPAKDGDDYEMTVTAVDVAGNESATAKDGTYTGNKVEDSASHYQNDNANLFTVDQTPPKVSVSFSNDNARNGKYFNAGRTATITVVEHNFDENRVELTIPGHTSTSPWNHSGDTHTMTVSYNADAQDCSFSVKITDKAGNVCPDAAVNYGGSVAVKDFVIDMTRPNVTYTGVDQSPYSGPCTPGFTSTDANLGNEFTFTVTRTNFKDGRKEITLPGSGTAASYSLANIPEDDRNNDGIYTVTVTVTDLAGNVTTLEPVEFAVNRFGSVYTLSKDLQNAVGKYFNKDGWAKTSKGKLAINEFNPTELKDGAKMEIYRDGVLVKSYTGAELKKLVSGGDRGSVGLYEYVYSLPTDVFSEDGVYRVVISSTDGADHKSANDKYGAEVSFVIDTVAPEIVSITGLEKHTVNAKTQDVAYQILDTYGLDRVTIRVNGPDSSIYREYISQAVLDSQNGKLESYQEMLPEGELDLNDAFITLPESSTPYHVVIEVTDKAGNTTVADGGTITRSTDEGAYTPSFDFLDSVTVSTNFFVRYIHNTGALIGTGVGVAAVAAGLWFVLAKRRKKDEEAA